MKKRLFRAKRLDNGEWVYGDLIHYRSNDYRILEQFNGDWDILEAGYRVDPTTIGQFVHKSTWGNFFEGDICHAPDFECNFTIVYEDFCFWAKTEDGGFESLEEYIGNGAFPIATIHDKE